ncbi:hypothetical protein ACFYYB_33060 [Streptomyces sp. NPDC002886]|uniref:hypothetical protein n=1 Tax=Streptomyces sp. NPDC002886 TaxID=3364667 RepID=UPI0036918255
MRVSVHALSSGRVADEIASALREYSRLSDSTAADSDAKIVALQAARRQALRVSRGGVEQHIAALEDYAAQVCEADLRYRELPQIQRLVELDLLARTAADALAVAEFAAMSAEAAIVAKTFRPPWTGRPPPPSSLWPRGPRPERAVRSRPW